MHFGSYIPTSLLKEINFIKQMIINTLLSSLNHFSSTSQPFNPDVVIADTDDEDEFAEIQRGTAVLKSVCNLILC